MFEIVSVVLQMPVAPVIAAALIGAGVQANGKCPSPTKRPDVWSMPIQPAPGRKTSAHALRSVKSPPDSKGGSRDPLSEASCTR